TIRTGVATTVCAREKRVRTWGPSRSPSAAVGIPMLQVFRFRSVSTDHYQTIPPSPVRLSIDDARREGVVIPLQDDNPTERTPFVTIAIIVACALVFFYQASLPYKAGELFVFHYGAIPAVVFGHDSSYEDGIGIPAYLTVLTSMFLHGGWMHLI